MSTPEESVRLQDITFAYTASGRAVFEGVCAAFQPGSLTAVTGPSGSGKSTLLYLVGLMVRPTAGTIHLGGARVDDRPDAERADLRARNFGFVFQDAVLDPTRTVLDNTLETSLYRRVSRQDDMPRAWALLKRFGVAERARHLPGQISGGQAQRIALCRALLGEPRILLADEPTGNLDAVSGDVVVAALTEHARGGGTVVLATHDRRIARQCDQVLEVAS